MGLLLGFGGSAVGILRTVGLLCLLLAGSKPLVQGGKGGAALGQLLFPVLQGQQPGGSIFPRGQLLFSSGQRCVQCGQLGAFRFGLGSGQLGSIPRGLLLMAQGIQLIVGGKGRLPALRPAVRPAGGPAGRHPADVVLRPAWLRCP